VASDEHYLYNITGEHTPLITNEHWQ
jgi:hypothetical protein